MRRDRDAVADARKVTEHEAAVAADRALLLAGLRRPTVRRRGWLTRRLLLVADVLGLIAAFLTVEWMFGVGGDPEWWRHDRYGPMIETVVFLVTLPAWIVVARLYGLYRLDEERMDHTTADDLMPVFHMVSVGVWLFMGGAWLSKLAQPEFPKMFSFWLLAITLVTTARVAARTIARRHSSYLQNVAVVGTGHVGRLVARKLTQHPEYGLNLIGFVDDTVPQQSPVGDVPVIGTREDLPELAQTLDIERVLITAPAADDARVGEMIHRLKQIDVLIDIVPRYFETIQPGLAIHAVGGIPVLGLPPARPARSSRAAKRALDVVLASITLLVTLPLFPIVAWLIKRESDGPAFFRQTRLGLNMRPFTILKFRTMTTDVDETRHRDYIRDIMSPAAELPPSGLYKLSDRPDVTRIGAWLRKTSLDELPQLLNVLRGDMSLVGPRPCLPYEVEHFKPHHFERFLVPPGLTGLWQVTSRARSTFGEALELDVAYARGWSLALDIWLLCRTPLQILA